MDAPAPVAAADLAEGPGQSSTRPARRAARGEVLHLHRLPPQRGLEHQQVLLRLHGGLVHFLDEVVLPTHLVFNDGALGLLQDLR